MKVAVTLAEMAAVDDSFEIRDNAIPEQYLEYSLNEWDEYALEAAVQLREADLATDVVTVTIGPDRSEETIRKGLAKGADRAVRIWDADLADLPLLDVHTKATLLAAALEDESPDLVLSGVQTGDDMHGATGVALASRLGYGWAAVVSELTVKDGTELRVRRELEGGVEEVSRVELPAVCTIQTGINEPRYASLRGIRMAQRAEIETLALPDLGLESAGLGTSTSLEGLREPVAESTAELLDGSATQTAGALASILRERGVGD